MQIQKKVLLAPYTTFKIGGEARYFGVVKNIEDLKEGVNFAKQNSLPIFILGGGSNLLISDKGFEGLVLKIEIKSLDVGLPSGVGAEVVVGAGVVLDELIEKAIKRNLGGMENLSRIPGTVGGGVVQNCGAFGSEIKDVVSKVEIFDIESGEIKKISSKDCQFKYRSSIFKKKTNWIITRAAFKFKENCNSLVERDKILEIRRKACPLQDSFGSAGCFFKNLIISEKELIKLKEKFPEIPFFEEGDKYKISVGWLLDKLGWKGFFKGEVGVYDKHALMLINKGKGTSVEIQSLAVKISDDVFKKTGLQLEKEVVFI